MRDQDNCRCLEGRSRVSFRLENATLLAHDFQYMIFHCVLTRIREHKISCCRRWILVKPLQISTTRILVKPNVNAIKTNLHLSVSKRYVRLSYIFYRGLRLQWGHFRVLSMERMTFHLSKGILNARRTTSSEFTLGLNFWFSLARRVSEGAVIGSSNAPTSNLSRCFVLSPIPRIILLEPIFMLTGPLVNVLVEYPALKSAIRMWLK